MTDETRRILDAALHLPAAERVQLAVLIADSVGDDSTPEDVEAAWLEEAKRRLAAYERGETTALDFEDSMRELEAKVRRPRERRASVG